MEKGAREGGGGVYQHKYGDAEGHAARLGHVSLRISQMPVETKQVATCLMLNTKVCVRGQVEFSAPAGV